MPFTKHVERRVQKRKANKRTLLKKTAVRKVKKKRCTDREALDSCSAEEEWPCLICAEPFSNSKANEVWVRCDICR